MSDSHRSTKKEEHKPTDREAEALRNTVLKMIINQPGGRMRNSSNHDTARILIDHQRGMLLESYKGFSGLKHCVQVRLVRKTIDKLIGEGELVQKHGMIGTPTSMEVMFV